MTSTTIAPTHVVISDTGADSQPRVIEFGSPRSEEEILREIKERYPQVTRVIGLTLS